MEEMVSSEWEEYGMERLDKSRWKGTSVDGGECVPRIGEEP